MYKYNILELIDEMTSKEVIKLCFKDRTIEIHDDDVLCFDISENDILLNKNIVIDCTNIECAIKKEKENV